MLASLPTSAATKTWRGLNGNIGLWSAGSNWADGVAPVNGDRIAFDEQSATQGRNDIAGLVIDGIDVGSMQSTPGYGGLAVRITNPSSIMSVNRYGVQLLFPITLPADATLADNRPPSTLGLFEFGTLTLGGGTTQITTATEVLIDAVTQAQPSALSIAAQTAQVGNIDVSGGVTFTGDYLLTSGHLGSGTAVITAQSFAPALAADEDFTTPLHLIGRTGQLIVIPNSYVFAPVRFVAPVTIGDVLVVVTPQIDTVFSGPISGPGALVIGAYPQALGRKVTLSSGNNTFTGGLQVEAQGKLFVTNTGSLPATSGVQVDTGGLLDIQSGAQSASYFSCSGTLEITLGATLHTANGEDVTGCTLELDVPPGYSPPATPITLITNTLDRPPLSTFEGLPEGTAITVAGATRYITYKGGGGGDIQLLASNAPLPPVGPGNKQDMWWAGPAENGWGMSLIQHDDVLFAALYVYDAVGQPAWLVMPGGTWNEAKTVYSGSLYRPIGTPFYAYDAQGLQVRDPFGAASITFQDDSHAILSYSVGIATGTKAITREVFATDSLAPPDRSDLWWGGSSQNGWGITILQQGSTLFAVWYTYVAGGAATWYVMPGGTWTAADTYEGTMYQTTGSPWAGVPYDASMLKTFNVGTFKFQFNGDNATFTYSNGGHNGSIPLVKEPF